MTNEGRQESLFVPRSSPVLLCSQVTDWGALFIPVEDESMVIQTNISSLTPEKLAPEDWDQS